MGLFNRKSPDVLSDTGGASVTVSYLTDLHGNPVNSLQDDYLANINARMANDIANVKVLTDNEDVYNKFNKRANSSTPSNAWLREFFYNYLHTGVALATIHDMKILDINTGNIEKVDDDYIYLIVSEKKLTLSHEEVIFIYDELYVSNTRTNNLFTIALKALLEKIPVAQKIATVIRLNAQVDPKMYEDIAKTLTKPGSNGTLIVDQSVDEVIFNNTNSNIDYTQIDFLLTNVLASLNFPKEIYFNTATPEQYKQYIQTKVKPIIKMFEEELNYKFNEKISIIHETETSTNAEYLKVEAMMGSITYNELRASSGRAPIEGGDVLIQNWNAKGNEKGNDKEKQATE